MVARISTGYEQRVKVATDALVHAERCARAVTADGEVQASANLAQTASN
jgi:hypothetical protein